MNRHLLMIAISALFLLPIVWMVSTSLKPRDQVFVFPPQFFTLPLVFQNYPDSVGFIDFWRYFFNTAVISILSVVGTLFSCPIAAYGFSRMKWSLREPLFYVCLSTVMLPFLAVMVPTYVLFKSFGWIGNMHVLWGWGPLIIPAFGGNPLYIFLLRQFYLSIPAELSESAVIDGATEFQVFWSIILPLSRSAITTVCIFTFVGNWTDFLAPRLFITEKSQYTLSLGLLDYFSLHQTEWTYLMAACVIFVLPVMILFFLAQRLFVEGISLTGIKA
ncbi:MAG TPA: carbohydrate ABC transporter permease [Aggregatilineales bacterium]|nr:carbohydrate ABC transporter permease [Aggregatilineales bacterium]